MGISTCSGIESLQTTPWRYFIFGTLPTRDSSMFFPLRVKKSRSASSIVAVGAVAHFSKTLHNLLHICLQILAF